MKSRWIPSTRGPRNSRIRGSYTTRILYSQDLWYLRRLERSYGGIVRSSRRRIYRSTRFIHLPSKIQMPEIRRAYSANSAITSIHHPTIHFHIIPFILSAIDGETRAQNVSFSLITKQTSSSIKQRDDPRFPPSSDPPPFSCRRTHHHHHHHGLSLVLRL